MSFLIPDALTLLLSSREGFIIMAFYYLGLSTCTFFISSFYCIFGIKRYYKIAKSSLELTALLLTVAPLSLILGLRYNVYPVTMAYGACLLVVFAVMCYVYSFSFFQKKYRISRPVGLLCAPIAIAAHGYAGYSFKIMGSLTPWYSPIVFSYFALSGLVSSLGLVILVGIFQKK
jgi:Ni/Fe-hydrogenase subunit HybB-like protein